MEGAIDPNDLIIFKSPENIKKEKKAAKEKERNEEELKKKVEKEDARKLKKQDRESERAVEKQTVEVPQVTAKPEIAQVPLGKIVPHKEEFAAEAGLAETAKLTKNEKADIAAAKGLACVNHPWRPAYAVCEICKRPFCYADTISYNGSIYCLEDIDKAGNKAILPGRLNLFAYLSAILFLSNSGILAYYLYPQYGYILGTLRNIASAVQALSIGGILAAINPTYTILFLNFLMAVLSVIASLMMLTRSQKSYAASSIIITMMLLAFSYEYINSNIGYTFIVGAISFMNVIVMSLSRMSAAGYRIEEEKAPADVGVSYPRIETL